jgi:hypothetical protein
MNAEQLTAFLKAAKDVPLLQISRRGICHRGNHIPYPVKEHHDLVTTKTIFTPPETILTARASKSDAKDSATKALFDNYKKSADTLTFRGHRNAPVAHKDCRYKSNDRPQKSASDFKRHDGANLGQAPPKKARNPKSAVSSTSITTKAETRTC